MQRILAIMAAVGLMGTAALSAYVTRKINFMLDDLGAVSVPLSSQFLLSVPAWLFLILGVVLATGIGVSIWRLRRPVLSIPAFLSVAVIAFLYLGVFSVIMLRPFGGLITKIQSAEGEQGALDGAVHPEPE